MKPDGCEYLGIARHLAREGAWVSSIKWHFFTDDPPRHPALGDRPPLFPLLAATVWRLSEGAADGHAATSEASIRAVRIVNAALAGLGTALALFFLARLFPFKAALGAVVLIALYPAWMRDSAQPLTEPLFFALWWSALLLFYSRPDERLLSGRAAALGAVSGLAYLTRPAGLLLPLFFTWISRRSRSLWLLWLTFALVWAPYGWALVQERGTPFYSILSYNFSIRHIYEGTLYGFERTFARPWEFVAERPLEVASLVAGQTWVLLSALGRSLRFLLPLALLLRVGDLRRRADLWLLASLNFLFHAISWTVWGAGRYLLPTYVLVAALLLEAPLWRLASSKWGAWQRRAAGAGAALAWLAAAAACLAADARLYREKAAPHAGVTMGWAYRQAATWLREEGPDVIGASNQPWILNLLSEQPTRIAPRFRDAAQARRFVDRYDVRHLVYFAEEADDLAVIDRLAPARGGRRQVAPELRDRLQLVRFVERRRALSPWRAGAEAPPPPPTTALLLLRREGA